MKKLICVALLAFGSGLLWADITAPTLSKNYTPTFLEWLQVFLHTTFTYSTTGFYTVNTFLVASGNGVRIKVSVYWTDTPEGREFISSTWPTMRETLRSYCESWTAKGYPINFDRDVDIDVKSSSQ